MSVTGPVARFARQIAGQGYICAAPSSYHEFTGPEALKYDAEDTDKGNAWKVGKVREAEYLHEWHRRYFYDLFGFIFSWIAEADNPRNSRPMTKTLVSVWIIYFRSQHATAASVPRACVSVGIWRIVVRSIRESRLPCATLLQISTARPSLRARMMTVWSGLMKSRVRC